MLILKTVLSNQSRDNEVQKAESDRKFEVVSQIKTLSKSKKLT